MDHEIVVGNICSVYYGKNRIAASRTFDMYKEYSQDGYGRAAGESVTWLIDDEIHKEYLPLEEN